jgi:hypothetical protein
MILDEVADLLVFDQKVGELLLRGVPAAFPAQDHAGAEAHGIDFLTHKMLFVTAGSRRVFAGERS